MQRFAALILCLTTCAWGAKKPDPVYQDAVLKSFSSVAYGSSCGGTTNTDTLSNSAHTRAQCTDTMRTYYVIVVGEQTMTVTPDLTGKESLASLSWATSGFVKKSSLYGSLPGTRISIRADSDPSKYRIKVGKRESLYKLVSAE